jgi:agmatine deiminase
MTPAELGFRQPAEWTPHDAVWTAWPYLVDEWAEGIEAPRQQLAAMCAAIGEPVEMLIRPEDEAGARALLGATPVRFHHVPYGDVWLRDTGPVFLARPGEIAAARFQWDGWGGKYLMPGDREVSAAVARLAGVRAFAHDFVLEGGAIEVDGEGTVLTTRQCLLGGQRNPGADEATMNRRLAAALGVDRVVWLDRGLANDHTDGHIDTLARFVAPGVVVCMEPAAGDPNRDALLGIVSDLRAARDAGGQPLEVMTVPSPGAVLDGAGALMPASYMNFYIGNQTVVVPIYGAAADDAALARLAPLFPGRRVVGVRAEAVLVGGGAFHCCTQQQPSLS